MSEHNRNDCASCWAEGDVATSEQGNGVDWGNLCVNYKGAQHYDSFVGCNCMRTRTLEEYLEAVDAMYGKPSTTPLTDGILADWYAGKHVNA